MKVETKQQQQQASPQCRMHITATVSERRPDIKGEMVSKPKN